VFSEGASSAAPSFPAGAGKEIFVDENTSLLGSGETEINPGFFVEVLLVVFINADLIIEPLTVCDRSFVLPGIAVVLLPSGAWSGAVVEFSCVAERSFFLAIPAYVLAYRWSFQRWFLICVSWQLFILPKIRAEFFRLSQLGKDGGSFNT